MKDYITTIAPLLSRCPRCVKRPSNQLPTHTSMTAAAMEQATPQDTLPLPDNKPSSSQPVVMQQHWGCHAAMPRLSEVVPGWKVDLENHNPVDGEGGDGAGEGVDKDRIPPHRRKVVRTRAAPAGPHPYLDRFASGMHRPLEGLKQMSGVGSVFPVACSWRKGRRANFFPEPEGGVERPARCQNCSSQKRPFTGVCFLTAFESLVFVARTICGLNVSELCSVDVGCGYVAVPS